MSEMVVLGVSDCIALVNQTLEFAYASVVVEGEVSSFKVNQGKYVFFDLKDVDGTLGCFMTVYQLRIPIQDGMRVRIVATPKLTQWGKFSLTVRDILPAGEGSIKKAFALLQAKLETEGLFAEERKRPLPTMPSRVAVISSTAAAGYADFVKIISERWGNVELVVAHVAVQGVGAADQIIRALEHFNGMAEPCDVVAIIRGGGSADDLAAFNDELLVRAIAASRLPVIVGVGHDTDTSLADLVADVRAATPSNAAQILVPDRHEMAHRTHGMTVRMLDAMHDALAGQRDTIAALLDDALLRIESELQASTTRTRELAVTIKMLDPRLALRRGYALARDADGHVIRHSAPARGSQLIVETEKFIITTGVQDVTERSA